MTIENKLNSYIHAFSSLHTDHNTRRWTEATRGQAPHKPFLLLSILDLFAEGRITTNLIEITPELGSLFAGYWERVLPDRRGNMALPFFHLCSSTFWHLVPVPGQEAVLTDTRQVDTLNQLNKLVLGARLDEDLYELLKIAEARNTLRTALIQTYFAPELQTILLGLSDLNLQSFIYSQSLIEQARKQVKESPSPDSEYTVVRDQGFRRAIIRIYENRCAFCGVRMLTTEGRTAVDAAHIIPWSVSHNDDVHNMVWHYAGYATGRSTKALQRFQNVMRLNYPVS